MSVDVGTWRELLRDNQAFMEKVVSPMVGWLDRYAAIRTLDLLEYQETNNVDGSLYEVGLYHGKYFALLARSAALTTSCLVGLDKFQYLSLEKFHAYFEEHVSPDNLAAASGGLQWSIIGKASEEVSARELISKLGREARFISIDGSHEYDDVLWDLRIADQVLAPGGIISADDFINPICLEVTAAIYHFLELTPAIVPFAHISNKLFLSRPGWADRYRSYIEKRILAEQTEPKSRDYRQNYDANARQNIEAAFRGYRILTIRL